jgi:hypothetical protein
MWYEHEVLNQAILNRFALVALQKSENAIKSAKKAWALMGKIHGTRWFV